MTVMPKFKTDTPTTTDVAYTGNHVVRVFASIPCPHCLRGRLRASSMRELAEDEFALTCTHCHRDAFTITFVAALRPVDRGFIAQPVAHRQTH